MDNAFRVLWYHTLQRLLATKISVKNSGHSYTNASSKGNTLLVNMHQYIPYATNLGPIDCDPDALTDSLEDQPCKLSLAKNKTAVIRVGGGENWGQVYKSIQNANKAQSDGYKYHVTGGAAATVSPMGKLSLAMNYCM